MGEVIDFPGRGADGINRALQHFKAVYSKAGLSEKEIHLAMEELEPIVKELLTIKEFEFNLSGSFTAEQIELIKSAHNEAMQMLLKTTTKI
ncbi:MAG: hypothetical protein WCH04_17250 [Gammaproteobacteria bacterium]